MNQKHEILIVDDERANLQKLKRTFVDEFIVHQAENGEQALEILRSHQAAVIITDQRMPGMSGVDLLKRSLELSPSSLRIILTGYTEVDDLMDAINEGHVHRYITKPWDPYSLRETVRKELESWALKEENARLARELEKANEALARENLRLQQEIEVLQPSSPDLIYQSRAMSDLLNMLNRVVETDSTVLLQGETGTGKELLARHVHRHSPRRRESFVPVNCGAVPADLVESAFFGHRKGSFTGALEDRKGFFELADQGTLFLDEIGEAPLALQIKLLRVLQEGEIMPLGAQRARRVDVRIIASTNRNLSRRVEEGRFRQDLFFRLNVFSVLVPPLRVRIEDVEILSTAFLKRVAGRLNKKLPGFEPHTVEQLKGYSWPGNVRELENEIERLGILSDEGTLIPPHLLSERIRFGRSSHDGSGATLKEKLAELEKKLILETLRSHNENKTRAARKLGITRQTIISKLKQYQN